MKNWCNRPKEIAYLLNPAFCARLVYSTIRSYNLETNKTFPFPLVYLILPLLLHRKTRMKISSRTQMINWLQQNSELLIGFAQRAKSMVSITNEAVEFLLQSKYIILTAESELEFSRTKRALSKTKETDDEIKECITKSEHLAKWFARTGKIETIYISWGIRP